MPRASIFPGFKLDSEFSQLIIFIRLSGVTSFPLPLAHITVRLEGEPWPLPDGAEDPASLWNLHLWTKFEGSSRLAELSTFAHWNRQLWTGKYKLCVSVHVLIVFPQLSCSSLNNSCCNKLTVSKAGLWTPLIMCFVRAACFSRTLNHLYVYLECVSHANTNTCEVA